MAQSRHSQSEVGTNLAQSLAESSRPKLYCDLATNLKQPLWRHQTVKPRDSMNCDKAAGVVRSPENLAMRNV
jgi:hypothetical protein